MSVINTIKHGVKAGLKTGAWAAAGWLALMNPLTAGAILWGTMLAWLHKPTKAKIRKYSLRVAKALNPAPDFKNTWTDGIKNTAKHTGNALRYVFKAVFDTKGTGGKAPKEQEPDTIWSETWNGSWGTSWKQPSGKSASASSSADSPPEDGGEKQHKSNTAAERKKAEAEAKKAEEDQEKQQESLKNTEVKARVERFQDKISKVTEAIDNFTKTINTSTETAYFISSRTTRRTISSLLGRMQEKIKAIENKVMQKQSWFARAKGFLTGKKYDINEVALDDVITDFEHTIKQVRTELKKNTDKSQRRAMLRNVNGYISHTQSALWELIKVEHLQRDDIPSMDDSSPDSPSSPDSWGGETPSSPSSPRSGIERRGDTLADITEKFEEIAIPKLDKNTTNIKKLLEYDGGVGDLGAIDTVARNPKNFTSNVLKKFVNNKPNGIVKAFLKIESGWATTRRIGWINYNLSPTTGRDNRIDCIKALPWLHPNTKKNADRKYGSLNRDDTVKKLIKEELKWQWVRKGDRKVVEKVVEGYFSGSNQATIFGAAKTIAEIQGKRLPQLDESEDAQKLLDTIQDYYQAEAIMDLRKSNAWEIFASKIKKFENKAKDLFDTRAGLFGSIDDEETISKQRAYNMMQWHIDFVANMLNQCVEAKQWT